MYRLLLVLTIALAACVSGFAYVENAKPEAVATSVIGEKPIGPNMGNQQVSKLPEKISEKQARLLRIAFEFGKSAGFKNPEIVQSIILQETMAGGMQSYKVANPGPEAYFGIGQIKLAAAKDVLKRHPNLYDKYDFHTRTDDEIKANLILNEHFNIEVSARYLKILQDYGYSGQGLLVAYNKGPGGAKGVDPSTNHYAVEATKKLKSFKDRKVIINK